MRTACTIAMAALVAVACEKPERPAPSSPVASTLVPASPVAPLAPTSAPTVAPTGPALFPVSAGDAPAPARMRFLTASPDLDVLSQVRSRRLEARAIGRLLVVYVGASWCPPCREFHKLSRTGWFDARAGKVTLLEFDVDEDETRLKAAGYNHRFIPFFVLPGPDGAPLDAIEIKGKAGEASQNEILRGLEAWQTRGTP